MYDFADDQTPVRWLPALTWRVRDEGDRTVVELLGDLDENVDFGELRSLLRGTVVLDLGGVRRIRSAGIREWLGFIRDLPEVTDLSLVACSVACVTQLNIVHNFRGPARIESFRAPYICARCGERDIVIERAQVSWQRATLGHLPMDCPDCGADMEFDDVADRYFQFLADA
jgi:anti-anti-sigma regulatory factor